MKIKDFTLFYCPQTLRALFQKITISPIGKRLLNGVLWSMVGTVALRGLMFFSMALIARILGKTIYGEFGMIQATIGMFGVLSGFGLGITANKYIAEFRHKSPMRAGKVICLTLAAAVCTGSIITILLFLIAPWVAKNTIEAPYLTVYLQIGSIILFLNALNAVFVGALSGLEEFKAIARINIIVGLSSIPLFVIGALYYDLKGTVYALLVSSVINLYLNWLALKKHALQHKITFIFKLKKYKNELTLLWKYSLPAVLSGIMVGPANWICRALLTHQKSGYQEIGILTATLLFQGMIMFVSSMLSRPLLSILSNIDVKQHYKISKINILSSWIVGVAISIPILCFPEIVQLMLGDDYTGYDFKITLSLIVFCTTIMTFKAGLSTILAAKALLWWGFFSNAFWAIVLILMSFIFVKYGAPGVAFSMTIAYFLNTIILIPLYYARRLVPRGTLISKESFIIWLVMLGLLIINIADCSIKIRIIIFLPSIFLVGYGFSRLAQKRN